MMRRHQSCAIGCFPSPQKANRSQVCVCAFAPNVGGDICENIVVISHICAYVWGGEHAEHRRVKEHTLTSPEKGLKLNLPF